MSVTGNLNQIKSLLPDNVKLVVVTKTHPTEIIMEAYKAGQRHFGENKVQELTNKALQLPADIKWHMIGHLQTNKVKHVIPFVSLIQGVDSYRLLQVINKEAEKCRLVVDCLLQIHIATESTKFGFTVTELTDLLNNENIFALTHVRICGLMGMASFSDDYNQVRSEFKVLKKLFDWLKDNQFKDQFHFNILSMGMSGDYNIAIEEGSTLIRIGSAIFGER